MDNHTQPVVVFASTENQSTQNEVSRTAEASNCSPLYDYVTKNVNLIPSAAKIWADGHIETVSDCSEASAKDFLVGFLDEPGNHEYRDVLNFLLPIIDLSLIADDFFCAPYKINTVATSGILKVDPGYLRMVMKAFPNIWGPLHHTDPVQKLLKVAEVALMLNLSDSQVRQLALKNEIQYTRSQGTTGHYRFKPEWVLEYQDKQLALEHKGSTGGGYGRTTS